MEDDDDVRSQSPSQSYSQSPSPPPQAIAVASAAAPSPHSHPNGASAAGRVTVAAAPQHLLTLALPIQPHRPGSASGGGVGGREDCWSEGATSALIDAWGERYLELSRGNLKQKQWQEVADAVSSRDDYTKPPKSDVQCKNRIDTLKKKYKLEKTKVTSGASPGSSWPFFHRLDLLIGPNSKPSSSSNPPPPPLPSANISHSRAAAAAAAAAAGPMHTPFPQRNRTHPLSQQNHKKRSLSSSSSKSGGMSADSSDGFPPETANGSKRRPLFPGRAPPPPAASEADAAAGEGRIRGLKELTQAIRQFGAVYERVESSKLQQAVEMAKQRMGFARELEVQRMQFFMKTQKELSQLKSPNHNHHSSGGSSKRKRTSGGTSSNNINNSNSSS